MRGSTTLLAYRHAIWSAPIYRSFEIVGIARVAQRCLKFCSTHDLWIEVSTNILSGFCRTNLKAEMNFRTPSGGDQREVLDLRLFSYRRPLWYCGRWIFGPCMLRIPSLQFFFHNRVAVGPKRCEVVGDLLRSHVGRKKM